MKRIYIILGIIIVFLAFSGAQSFAHDEDFCVCIGKLGRMRKVDNEDQCRRWETSMRLVPYEPFSSLLERVKEIEVLLNCDIADCKDGNPCTYDECAGGYCYHTYLDGDECFEFGPDGEPIPGQCVFGECKTTPEVN